MDRRRTRTGDWCLMVMAVLFVAACVVASEGFASRGQAVADDAPPCDAPAPEQQHGDSNEPSAWVFSNLTIPQLSIRFAKFDLFAEALEPAGHCAWPEIAHPAAGPYEIVLETDSTATFDLYTFLVPADPMQREVVVARFLESGTGQGGVSLTFEIPEDIDPVAWSLIILFDEDLCWLLSPSECATLGPGSPVHQGTLRLLQHPVGEPTH